MRRVRRALVLGAALLLPACAPGQPTGAQAGGSGLVVVTAGGTALVDGEADVPPTLDLRISASHPLTSDAVGADLDGAPLGLAAAHGAVTASVAPMPLGSAHRLDLRVAGRPEQRLGFHVVGLAGAMAALHTDPRDGAVLDLAVQYAPDHRAVEAALPAGAALQWVDARHLRATWHVAPGGTLVLPPALPVSRGSHLAGALRLALDPVPDGAVRSAVVPRASGGVGSPVVLAFTVATARSRASLAAHIGQVSVVSPTGVGIGTDGTLSGAPDAPAVAVAQRHGVPVWPLLQNDASDSTGIAAMLEDGGAVQRLVAAARGLAAGGSYPGLQLDIEGVPAAERDHLTGLVRELAAGLHANGRRLAVAVVPHKPDHLNVYSAAYDLPAIAAAADLVTLMAYDEHTSLTDAGAVAGLGWDRQILDGSLPELRAPQKTLLGLPLYARRWGDGGVVADSYSASLATAVGAPGARLDYDFAAATPYVREGDGSSTTWFDDAASLSVKGALAGSLHLRGVALWRLGFEDPATWSILPATAAPL
jgi:spore germination protein YaaH